MKKLLIAFSMVGAVALIACATDNSVKPNYDSADWFSASANVEPDSIAAVGGEFSVKTGSASTYKANDERIEIDGDDVSDPVSFVLSDANTKTTDLTRVVFELDASLVPVTALPKDEELTGAKTAFALCKDGETRQFYAWVGATPAWTSLNFTSIPVEDETYTLTMRFDDTVASAPKVQFTVGSESSAWFAYVGMNKTTKPQIDFVGCGKLKSMNADQVWIVSSEVVIEGGSVMIDEKDMAAMNKLADGGKIEDVLATDVSTKFPAIAASCKLNVAEAYAIGLITNANDTMVAAADGTFKMKADATAKVAGDKIAIKFVDELTPADPDATVTYSLLGQKTAGGAWEPIDKAQNKSALSEVAIPTTAVTGGYRYFKVVTKVQLKSAD